MSADEGSRFGDGVLDADEAAPPHDGFLQGEWPCRDAAEYEPSEPADNPWDLLRAASPPPSVHEPPFGA